MGAGPRPLQRWLGCETRGARVYELNQAVIGLDTGHNKGLLIVLFLLQTAHTPPLLCTQGEKGRIRHTISCSAAGPTPPPPPPTPTHFLVLLLLYHSIFFIPLSSPPPTPPNSIPVLAFPIMSSPPFSSMTFLTVTDVRGCTDC